MPSPCALRIVVLPHTTLVRVHLSACPLHNMVIRHPRYGSLPRPQIYMHHRTPVKNLKMLLPQVAGVPARQRPASVRLVGLRVLVISNLYWVQCTVYSTRQYVTVHRNYTHSTLHFSRAGRRWTGELDLCTACDLDGAWRTADSSSCYVVCTAIARYRHKHI